MKKALSMLLMLALCLSLCACDNTIVSTDNPSETISVYELFEDMSNGAKCELNIGKQVTVLGQIEYITSDSCRIQLISHPETYVIISMSTEKLAELSVDQFIAVSGTVESFNSMWAIGTYTISAKETLDNETMNTVFDEIITRKLNYGEFNSAYAFKESLHILYEYMSDVGSFTMQNKEELMQYLCGNWECGFFELYNPNSISASKFETFYITYNEDGSVKYSTENSWRDDWSVGDYSSLQSFFGKKTVYVLSDDVFICNGYVFVRQDSICFRTITLSDKDTANYVLKLWQDGEATDNSMKELMDEYGADQGGGQLYELYPIDKDMFLDEIAGWCLHYSRMAGDAEIIRTDYGYAIVYIVSLNNG